ncbi:ABC transporter permease [Rugosimonospora africana]|uniref:ABC transporter permease n=1 Tax=Rugosimonospora africana TaxID=556532 RepID=A0A8J3QR72_9ACTN|nr:ABC transporter permease [Rugosimonospora africana]GIH15378.1 ABC transporter permease [Rugosimonospora africana]
MSSVWLVAQREILARARSKAYVISTVVLVVIVVAVAILTKLIGGSGHSDFTVGVTGQTSSLSAPLSASAKSIGQSVATNTVPDEATGRDEVKSGKLDALLVGDGRTVQVVVKKDLDTKLGNALHVLAGQVAFNQKIESLGGDPADVNAAVAGAAVTVTSIQRPHTYNTQQLVLGIIAGILIYLSLLLSGQMVAQGVVEEKSSRVVELLLSAIRPWQLMAGKVVGLGIVGFVQMVLVGGAGITAGLLTGALTIPTSAALSTVIWLVVWYLLGFVAYALTFAAAAATVSRQEDVGGVVTPILMLVIAGYVLGVSILPGDPSSGLIETLSMLPMFAPTLMPMRVAMGGVPVWQLVVAVGGMVVVIPLLVLLSARIYRNAVLRSGARVKLRDAWRAA